MSNAVPRAEVTEAKLARLEEEWAVKQAQKKSELDECYSKIQAIQAEKEELVAKHQDLTVEVSSKYSIFCLPS